MRDRHEGWSPWAWLGAGWAIGPGDAHVAIVGSLGALPWAGKRAMHTVRSRMNGRFADGDAHAVNSEYDVNAV